MIGNRQQQARFQSGFYRDNYHKILRALIITNCIILILIVTIIYFVLVHPSPDFYATTLSGQIIPMTPLK